MSPAPASPASVTVQGDNESGPRAVLPAGGQATTYLGGSDMNDRTSFVKRSQIEDRLAAIAGLARYAADGRLTPDDVADAIAKHVGAIHELIGGAP